MRKKSKHKCGRITILIIKYEIVMKDFYDTFIDKTQQKKYICF